MSRTEKRQLGDIGESLACRYLIDNGFRIIERNYWKPWGEIDIIAEKAKSIRFIEVKSVSREANGGVISRETDIRPEENMHPAKIQRLHRAIQTYLADKNVADSQEWQLDLACVYIDSSAKMAKVDLLENIVL